jgi:hypothetical protein
MRALSILLVSLCLVALCVLPAGARGQTASILATLRGLAPFSALLNTAAGKAALDDNYRVTAAIQHGTAGQPGLQPFPAQQEQALKDASVTDSNAFQLADGLGTNLGGIYQSLTGYTSSDDGATTNAKNVSPTVAALLADATDISGADSASAKYFFGDAITLATKVTKPVADEANAIMQTAGGTPDAYGKEYHLVAGSPGADPYGDSRPFQTSSNVLRYSGTDIFGVPSTNYDFLVGPKQSLIRSPSFPSGHTTYGYTESLLLACMVPERYTQMITRGAEYGNSRIVLGAHYAMDVIAGRTLAYYVVAHLLDNNAEYEAEFRSAANVLTIALAANCGKSRAACALDDTSRFSDPKRNRAFYESTQTYGLSTVYAATASKIEDVSAIAPEAGTLLTAAFPKLTLEQADKILTETEGPGGGFLDNGSAFGLYSRLDLYRAGEEAAALSTKAD